VKISSRKLLASSLKNVGIPETQLLSLYPLLDKYSKMPGDTFEKMLSEQVIDESITKKVMDFMGATTLSEVSEIIGTNAEVEDAVQELARLKELLSQMGVWQYCDFYPSIVRGLAYYTGVVFEVHEFAQELRAICGGGRYDNLLHDFGGPRIPATGMGMGDCVLGILLDERELFKPESKELDYFVAFVDEVYRKNAIKLTMKLRSAGFVTNFSYKAVKLSRQLKEASAQNAKNCIIVGEEYKNNQLVIKDMTSGKQELVNINEFLSQLES
jgi:histidyl-tRNA synthetase